VFRFGRFELDLDRGELRREGGAVRLSPQPLKALTLFVSRAGELVTRDELRRALWSDDNFVDFNAGVNFCIAQLRAALDDPASRSAYLVAVPRRGYRFVATVERVAGGRSGAARDAEVTVGRSRGGPGHRRGGVAGVLGRRRVAAHARSAPVLRAGHGRARRCVTD
jgi:DNA-binding winged helix-turn-helix (wHTH) protein